MADVFVSAGTGASDSGAMAGLPTVTTNFDKTVTALVHRTVEENLRHATRWMVPGSYRSGTFIPGTNLIRHIAYGDLATATSEVAVEGEPPDVEPLVIGYDEYVAKQRARLVGINDVSLKMSPHELMAEAAERIAFDAISTVDASIAAAVNAGSGLTLTVAGAALVAEDVRRWVAQLKTAEIPPFPDGFYVANIHPNVTFDLQGDTAIGGWIEASKYADPSRLLNGEIGRMYGVRFVETTVGTINVGATDTYNTVLYGPNYYAFGDLQTIETYMVRPGGDHSDPLAQKALVGYKGMWGAKTLEIAELAVNIPANPDGVRFGIAAAHAGTLDLTA